MVINGNLYCKSLVLFTSPSLYSHRHMSTYSMHTLATAHTDTWMDASWAVWSSVCFTFDMQTEGANFDYWMTSCTS